MIRDIYVPGNALQMTSHETIAIIGKSGGRKFFKQGGKVVNGFHSEKKNTEVKKCHLHCENLF